MTRTPPSERLLDVAGRLFARRGIRAVGIDLVIAEAGVSKASLYQAFGSKDALVVAYLERQDAADRQHYRAAAADVPPGADRVLLSFELAEKASIKRGYRGCVYLNALTEFPDLDHPIAAAVTDHRTWVRRRWEEALGDGADEALLDSVQLLYDGALAASKAEHSTSPFHRARALVRDLVDRGAGSAS